MVGPEIIMPGGKSLSKDICLGTFPFGFAQPEHEAFGLMDVFFESGGNCLDTAHVYGTWSNGACNCESEKTIGKWLSQRKNRHQVILGTKGGSIDPYTQKHQSGRRQILWQLDNSLRNLQTDYIDLYWLHRDDRQRPVSHFIDLLNDQANAGKIRCFGCSNWTTARMAEADAYARLTGQAGFFANQPWWSLAKPNFDRVTDKTMVWLDDEGIAYHRKTLKVLIPYSSQARHFFSRMESRGSSQMDEELRALYFNDRNLGVFHKMKEIAAREGYTLDDIALGALVGQPFPVIPIVGCRNPEQVRALFESLERIRGKPLDRLISLIEPEGE